MCQGVACTLGRVVVIITQCVSWRSTTLNWRGKLQTWKKSQAFLYFKHSIYATLPVLLIKNWLWLTVLLAPPSLKTSLHIAHIFGWGDCFQIDFCFETVRLCPSFEYHESYMRRGKKWEKLEVYLKYGLKERRSGIHIWEFTPKIMSQKVKKKSKSSKNQKVHISKCRLFW